ncbi:MAG: malate dehydrogenase [Campylobacteraceae bacterium]|jgi:malate dehydrogenase|nr:malate dehydrogenase [Campylobacteraceae bacterium]
MKVTIIGAGNVGASTCFLLASKNICSEIVLIDIVEDMAIGKAIDISQSCSAFGVDTLVYAQNEYSKISNSDIVVITAGVPRKPGMSREDLLQTNAKIISSVTDEIKKYAPNSIIIVVSNPLDVLTYVTLKLSGFEKSRVIGMGGMLDSARMTQAIFDELGYPSSKINSLVIGTHGEEMLPLARFTFVDGKNLEEITDKASLEKIIQKTKSGGAEIVKRLGTSAYYAPAASVCILIDAIIKDKKTIHPCSTLLQGEYGSNDVCIGVPVVIGKNGIEKIEELSLNDKESQEFIDSVNAIKKMINILKI